MGDLVALPFGTIRVSAITGVLDDAGQRYGWLMNVETGTLRVWRMRDGSPADGDPPERIMRAVERHVRAMLAAGGD